MFCEGVTAKGLKCGKKTQYGETYCKRHEHQSEDNNIIDTYEKKLTLFNNIPNSCDCFHVLKSFEDENTFTKREFIKICKERLRKGKLKDNDSEKKKILEEEFPMFSIYFKLVKFKYTDPKESFIEKCTIFFNSLKLISTYEKKIMIIKPLLLKHEYKIDINEYISTIINNLNKENSLLEGDFIKACNKIINAELLKIKNVIITTDAQKMKIISFSLNEWSKDIKYKKLFLTLDQNTLKNKILEIYKFHNSYTADSLLSKIKYGISIELDKKLIFEPKPILSHYISPYSILGVKYSDSEKDIRTQWKKLMIINHPDKNPDNKDEFTKKAQTINEAYVKIMEIHNNRKV